MSRLADSVPRDYAGNLQYRLEIRDRAMKDPKFARVVMDECRNDALYWINTFCCLFEPRIRRDAEGNKLPQVIPFITWPHQEPVIDGVTAVLGEVDIGVEKARAEGASWIFLVIFLWKWLFYQLSAFGLVSRNEKAVDNPDDPDSLMWKLDWELEQLPKWMLPRSMDRNRLGHVLRNNDNKSTIVGYSATGDVASGGRKMAFLMDELAKFPRPADKEAMASTQYVTDCRIINSTPKGPSGAYYEAMHSDNNMVKFILDWRDNPTKNKGLYTVVHGQPVVVDPRNPLPPDFLAKWATTRSRLEMRGYDVKGNHSRSPWYDNECLRPAATPLSIAQELDRDYGGSMATFFSIALIEKLLARVRQPIVRGELQWDDDTHKPTFIQREDGTLKLWIEPQVGGHPPATVDYIVGADISAGMGGAHGSNSVASVMEKETGRKVAEFATPRVVPEKFADYCIALCNWFKGPHGPALLIWEVNGYGQQFTARVREVKFGNIFWRTLDDSTSKRTKKEGFLSSKKTKHTLLGNYSYRLAEGMFINPSADALNEAKDYQLFADGTISHVAATSKEDPTGAGEAHGDRVIADALCAYATKPKKKRGGSEMLIPAVPQNSFLSRRIEANQANKSKYW